ncbi:hypothetical protein D7X48_18040 [bacterium D16-50]|nr:hypothetical protein D7X48_18040 [bacterium D16-50]
MKKICMYLGYATIALGSIGSFIIAKNLGVSLTEGRYSVSYARNWPMTFGYFIGCLFVTAIFSAVLLGISKILESLEIIGDTLEETAEEPEESEEEPLIDGWKCPSCGNNNPYYTGTCSCGQPKP